MRFLGALIRLVVRLLLIPVKLVLRVGRISFRTGVAVGTAPVKVSWWAGRRAGLKALVALAVGAALGLLLAPVPGEKLRRKLLAAFTGGEPVTASDPELTAAIRAELENGPRTWHLTQPDVSVLNGRVTLSGTVASIEAATELERAAASVTGVSAVLDEMVASARTPDEDDTQVLPEGVGDEG